MTKVINWDRVEQSLVLHNNGNDKFAEALLLSAITEEEDGEPEEVNKDYGKNGYTDAFDVRDVSAQSHSVNRPHTSIHLIVHQRSTRKYKLEYIKAFGPTTGGNGRHVAKVFVPSSFNSDVILATGYGGNSGDYDNYIRHSVGQEIVITNKFSLPNLGSAGIFLMENGEIVSDEVGSIGLPDGDHFCFDLKFIER